MSITYTAYLVHGVVIPVQALAGRNRGCTHPASSAKFCHECGEPMWEQADIKDSLEMSQACRVGDIGWIRPRGSDTCVVGIVLAVLDSDSNPWHRPVPNQPGLMPEASELEKMSTFFAQVGALPEKATLQLVLGAA